MCKWKSESTINIIDTSIISITTYTSYSASSNYIYIYIYTNLYTCISMWTNVSIRRALNANISWTYGWVPFTGVREIGHDYFEHCLVACSTPSHCLNHDKRIAGWAPRNIPMWNLNQNAIVSIQENAFENIVCKMSAIFDGLDVISRQALCLCHQPYGARLKSPVASHNGFWDFCFKSRLSLTHRGQDKMAIIFKTAISNTFSWTKMYEFRLRFDCSSWCSEQYYNIVSNNGLAPTRRQAIIWTNDGYIT